MNNSLMEMQHEIELSMEAHLTLLEHKIDEFKEQMEKKFIELHNELTVLKKLYKEGKTNVKNGCDTK